jgi:hypothetical protein
MPSDLKEEKNNILIRIDQLNNKFDSLSKSNSIDKKSLSDIKHEYVEIMSAYENFLSKCFDRKYKGKDTLNETGLKLIVEKVNNAPYQVEDFLENFSSSDYASSSYTFMQVEEGISISIDIISDRSNFNEGTFEYMQWSEAGGYRTGVGSMIPQRIQGKWHLSSDENITTTIEEDSIGLEQGLEPLNKVVYKRHFIMIPENEKDIKLAKPFEVYFSPSGDLYFPNIEKNFCRFRFWRFKLDKRIGYLYFEEDLIRFKEKYKVL